MGFPHSSAGKESAYDVGDLGSVPELERTPGEGNGYPLQFSGRENSMAGTVHGVTELDMTEQLSLSLVQFSRSVVSDSLRPHRLYSPWNSPGQNTGVGSLSLLQGIFPT